MRSRVLPLIAGIVLVVVAGTAAYAQTPERAAVAGGYSFLAEIDTPGITHDYPAGWFAGYHSAPIFARLSIAGEVTGSQRRNAVNEVQRLLAVLAGPRMAVLDLGRLHVSAALLIGKEWFSEPGFDESGLAFEPGASIDVPLAGRVGARVGAGYRMVSAEGDTFKELRVSAGGVLWLGSH